MFVKNAGHLSERLDDEFHLVTETSSAVLCRIMLIYCQTEHPGITMNPDITVNPGLIVNPDIIVNLFKVSRTIVSYMSRIL